jgi:hypothetical protein
MKETDNDFAEFMKKRISHTERRKGNCIGTALYIVGEKDSDNYLSRDESRKMLSKMKFASKPELGYLVLWASGGIPYHAGTIFMENPFYIVHRSEKNGLLTKEALETFNEYMLKTIGLKPNYKIPNKLLEETK